MATQLTLLAELLVVVAVSLMAIGLFWHRISFAGFWHDLVERTTRCSLTMSCHRPHTHFSSTPLLRRGHLGYDSVGEEDDANCFKPTFTGWAIIEVHQMFLTLEHAGRDNLARIR